MEETVKVKRRQDSNDGRTGQNEDSSDVDDGKDRKDKSQSKLKVQNSKHVKSLNQSIFS